MGIAMSTLREFAERCRNLALVTRSEALRQHLFALAKDLEQEAGRLDRRAMREPLNRDAC
jgi:short-subunit dehydrogenase